MARNSRRSKRVKLALMAITPHCRVCGHDVSDAGVWRATVDHIMPVVRGGSNELQNLTLLCHFCNASKGDHTLDEWAAMILKRSKAIREESSALTESMLPAPDAGPRKVIQFRGPADAAEHAKRHDRWRLQLHKTRVRRQWRRRVNRVVYAVLAAFVSLLLFVINPALPATKGRC